MTSNVIEVFLTDTLLARDMNFDINDKLDEPNVGYMSSLIKSFFMYPSFIKDVRDVRLQVLGSPVDGKMTIHFDGYIENFNDLFSTLQTDDYKDVRGYLMNVIERAYLSQSSDAGQLDTEMASSAEYTGYVAGSLFVSGQKTPVTIKYAEGSSETRTIQVPNYISFKFIVDGIQQEFKVYLNNQSFYSDYAVSIITQIILPTHGRYLLDPSKNQTIINAVINASEDIFTNVDTEVKKDDHTGNLTFKTRYMVKSSSFEFMPFGVFYKGKKPSTLYIREKIREKLKDTNLADESVWKELFPDLYITAQFYMVPIWDNMIVRPVGEQYPSIINHEHIRKVMGVIFPDLDSKYIDEHLELIMSGACEVFTACIPDMLNEDKFSIQEIHPTYNYHLTQDPGHMNMDPTTRLFNVMFNECIHILLGNELLTGAYIPSEVDGREYYAFSVEGVEYYVLTQAAFPKM